MSPQRTVVTEVGFCGCTNTQLEAGKTCGRPECPNVRYRAVKGAAGWYVEDTHLNELAAFEADWTQQQAEALAADANEGRVEL